VLSLLPLLLLETLLGLSELDDRDDSELESLDPDDALLGDELLLCVDFDESLLLLLGRLALLSLELDEGDCDDALVELLLVPSAVLLEELDVALLVLLVD